MGNQYVLKDKYGNHYDFDDENVIGQGGMGIVYLGRKIDQSGAESKVAIKEIKAKTKEIIERAQRESQIQLNHDNLVRMYAFVESEVNNDGFVYKNYYVISEYLEGILLDDIIKGKLANEDGTIFPSVQDFYDRYQNDRDNLAKEVIKAVLSGVMALHDKGFLHRDIDPTNIMITSTGEIKLIDFGIAKKLSEVSSMERKLTTPGAFVGKPEYSAPELIRGDVEHQGYYTDVYAIGILYFQLLTGHIPFEGSRYEIIKQHLNSKMPLKELSSKTTRNIIKKATEKDYKNRYASSALFRAAIDAPGNQLLDNFPKTSIGIIVLLAIIGSALYIFKDKMISPQVLEEVMVINHDSLEYENAALLLKYEIRDSLMLGIERMKNLAEKGNEDAVRELVLTYAWIPNDNESNRRKALLGIEVDDQTKQPLSAEVNKNAFEWLNKAISLSDSADYKCLYWQSFYYLNGLFVNSDMNVSKRLLNKSKEQANISGDYDFLDKINKTIEQIK